MHKVSATLGRVVECVRTLVPSPRHRSSNRAERRVVVTGLGIVSPIGIGVQHFWQNLLRGESGIRTMSLVDPASFPSTIAGEVVDFDDQSFLPEPERKSYSRATRFAVMAAELARQDAALGQFDPYATDTIIGCGAGAFEFIDTQVFQNSTAGRQFEPGTFNPHGIGQYSINLPACAVAYRQGIKGYTTTLSTACASGLSAIGLAADRIRGGLCSVAVTGATDCAVNYFTVNLFCAADFLNTEKDPSKAMFPFDRRRTRSVLAEGACLLVLEEFEHAAQRGARMYGEIAKFAQEYENQDGFFRLDLSGEKWGQVIARAVDQKPIDFVSAHGPSDQTVDAVESRALAQGLGPRREGAEVASIKAAVGSAFGAAGALQTAVACLALEHQLVPPTLNFREPCPECPVSVHPLPQRGRSLKRALVTGHGFGGVNCAVVLDRVGG